MTKYFIGTRPLTDGSHIVHKVGCPLLPEPGRRILLGVFQSPCNALNESRRYFSKPHSCPFCLKEHPQESNIPVFSEVHINPEFVSFNQLKVTWVSSMLCSMN